MPAVINILLGLRQRDATGEGVYLDVAMTDAHVHLRLVRLRDRASDRQIPGPGEMRLVGAARRAISSTRRETAGSSRAARWSEILARLLQRHSVARAADARPRRRGRDQRAVAELISPRDRRPLAAEVRAPPTAASSSWPRWKRRCTTRISSSAACSRIRWPVRAAKAIAGAAGCRLPRRCATKPGVKRAESAEQGLTQCGRGTN